MQEYRELFNEVTDNVLTFCGVKKRHFPQSQSLEGQIIVVTGANRSTGREAAVVCASKGALVVLACRKPALAKEVEKEIIDAGGQCPLIVQLDLCSFESIVNAAEDMKKKLPRIDVIIHNAGMIARSRVMTVDNIESTVEANYVGQVLLTEKLVTMLNRSSNSKVIFVSSLAHHAAWKDADVSVEELFQQESFSMQRAYAQSKAASLMYCRMLAKMHHPHIKCYAVDPGIFESDIVRDKPRWMNFLIDYYITRPFLRTRGEATSSILAPLFLSSDKYDVNKLYFGDGQEKQPSAIVTDDAACELVYGSTRHLLAKYLTGDENENEMYPNISSPNALCN